MWTRDGIVTAVHQQSNSDSGTNWDVLVYIDQQSDNGYLVNTGSVALNGLGTQGHGNYCWDDGNGNCLRAPHSFSLNQTLMVEALQNGNFMLRNR